MSMHIETNNYAARLADNLADQGLLDESWKQTFTHTPRHLFLRDFYRRTNNAWELITPSTVGEERWLQLVYQDVTWVQRLGGPNSQPGTPASSCIQPSLAALMLTALAVGPGDQILEIGAGTGWLTALLSHHCAADNITAIELDPELVDQAHMALTKLGYNPHLVCADGADGFPDRAPYNAILSTAALSHIPLPWLHQTRPGVRIVTPIRGAIAIIDVRDSTRASGYFLPEPVLIIPLRSPKNIPHIASATNAPLMAETARTLAAMRDKQFRAFLGVTRPGLIVSENGLLGDLLVADERGDSIQVSPLGQIRSGHANLLANVLATVGRAHQQWERAGCPSLADLRIEVDELGQWLHVHRASSEQRWRIQ